MVESKPALYAAGVTCLSFICLALAGTAVGLPIWGTFENPSGGWEAERGYFGPWTICKTLNYGREICGRDDFRFKTSTGIYISGILAAISCGTLGLFCILSIIQIAMITSKDKVVMNYKPLVIIKLILSIASALLAIAAAILFAIQLDSSNRSFTVSRGISFYLQIIVIVLTIGLFVMALYDVFFTLRPGGDPTKPLDITGAASTTFNNPGFREGKRTNGASISMTDSSGKPYAGVTNGSMVSMNTTVTSVSNGSTIEGSVTRSPLRSSLKKPRARDGFGIQNPGFSGSSQSPQMNRNGSMKKVRIQTHSTEV